MGSGSGTPPVYSSNRSQNRFSALVVGLFVEFSPLLLLPNSHTTDIRPILFSICGIILLRYSFFQVPTLGQTKEVIRVRRGDQAKDLRSWGTAAQRLQQLFPGRKVTVNLARRESDGHTFHVVLPHWATVFLPFLRGKDQKPK